MERVTGWLGTTETDSSAFLTPGLWHRYCLLCFPLFLKLLVGRQAFLPAGAAFRTNLGNGKYKNNLNSFQNLMELHWLLRKCHLDPEYEIAFRLAGGGPEGLAPGMGQMGNPDTGLVRRVFFCCSFGLPEWQFLKTHAESLKMWLFRRISGLGGLFAQQVQLR